MIKEIHEIPQAIRDTMRGRVTEDDRILLQELGMEEERIRRLRKLFIVACGTAYYAGFAGKYLFERLLRIPVEVDIASEFRYRKPIYEPDSMLIVISQSGETADTLAALRDAKRHEVPVLGIVNVIGSSIYREADFVFPTWAGPEICVASTKAYVTQLIAQYLLALGFAQTRGQMREDQVREYVAEMKQLPQKAQGVLDQEPRFIEMAKRFADRHDFFFIGRGLDYAVSLEGALKLKEISYIHAEAYAAGELKHGPLALLTEGVPVVCIATQTDLHDKMLSNIKEVKARWADAIGIVRESDGEMEKAVDYLIRVPDSYDLFMPVLAVIPPYLLTYYIARELQREIDQPRNLAKSVTVE
jgi:glucosamine--fructose-6-phosphate aminotransferase (isomerizing)